MDSSFSTQDGDTSFCPPTASSSPVKKRYKCPHCPKTYVVNFYFEKHLETHSSQGVGDESQASELHLDASDLSIDNGGAQAQQFKKPKPPKKKVAYVKKKALFTCTYCLKKFVSDATLRNHMRLHTIQVAASRFPDRQKILNSAEEIGGKALTKVANCVSCGDNGKHFKELVGHVIGLGNVFCDFSTMILTQLVSVVDAKKCMLPSALLKSLFSEMESILNNEPLYEDSLAVLQLNDFNDDTQAQFFIEFMLNLTTEVFKFISSSFREQYQQRLRQPMPELDDDDRQVIYYVAGSVMRGYFRMAYRRRGNLKWQSISSVLKNRVLCSAPVGNCDSEWTQDIDRGGLLYVNSLCHNFFLSLTRVIYENEKKDGSLDYNEVIDIVSKTDISVQWDSLIQDDIPEELSIGLMNDVIQCFCKACGRGIARRRLNALREKPVISMPTRHAVASRKK